ncbi:MAG TPA: hypothetical protein VJR05_12535 [Acidimicrobiia bacterium]|nr:hypothetical protein [Acidimicrobiia bacterium]
MIKSAYLRVYLPEERVPFCDEHADGPDRPTRRWEPYGFVGESMIEDAWMTEWRGRRFVCPRRPQLRILEGVLALHQALEVSGRAVLIPEAVARQAVTELRSLQRREPGIRSHILTSAWHVPIRWFVPFAPEERLFDNSGSRPDLRYRTGLSDGVDRLERALAILTEVEMPAGILAELSDFGSWLSGFPVDSMIELDYGRVADLFPEADLALDESVREVWESLAALKDGDWTTAGERYGELMSRWAPAFAITYSN